MTRVCTPTPPSKVGRGSPNGRRHGSASGHSVGRAEGGVSRVEWPHLPDVACPRCVEPYARNAQEVTLAPQCACCVSEGWTLGATIGAQGSPVLEASGIGATQYGGLPHEQLE